MSVPIIASAWQYFHKLPKDDFTGIMIQALSMSKLINDFNKADLKRLAWIEEHTHKNINHSIYELDRYVDKTKGLVNNNKYIFNNGEFTQDKIQHYLCLAISEVYQIIYKNFKDYKIEEKLNLDGETTSSNSGGGKWL
jgi:hypothetical protein